MSQKDRKHFPENRVFVDETGVNDNIVVQYGWAGKGKRSYAEQSGHKTERLSIVAAYVHGTKKLIAPFEFSGHTDTALFVGWFKHVLCPALKPGQTVILDNASFHKSAELYDLAENIGCQVLFLPPYSPDMNPIEKVWANFKRKLRALIKKAEDFKSGITEAMQKSLPG